MFQSTRAEYSARDDQAHQPRRGRDQVSIHARRILGARQRIVRSAADILQFQSTRAEYSARDSSGVNASGSSSQFQSTRAEYSARDVTVLVVLLGIRSVFQSTRAEYSARDSRCRAGRPPTSGFNPRAPNTRRATPPEDMTQWRRWMFQSTRAEYSARDFGSRASATSSK